MRNHPYNDEIRGVINISDFFDDLRDAAKEGAKILRDQVDIKEKDFKKKGVAFEFQLVAEIYHILKNRGYKAGFRDGLFLETNYGGLHVDLVYTVSSGEEHLVEIKPVRTLKKMCNGLKKGNITRINKDLDKLKELDDIKISEKILVIGFIGDNSECKQEEFDKVVRSTFKAGQVKLITC